MRLADRLQGLSSDLGDAELGYEFSRWSQQDLLRWWNEGACIVASLRPDLFSRPLYMTLEPGSIQTLCGCSAFGRVLGQVDDSNAIIGHPLPGTLKMQQRFNKPGCERPRNAGGQFLISGYTFDPQDRNIITVTPPVPKGERVRLAITCTVTPTESKLTDEPTDLDCGNVAAVTQWVLFRALYREDENTEQFRKAMASVKLFFTLLNLKFKAELLYELGIVPVNKGTQLMDSGSGNLAA